MTENFMNRHRKDIKFLTSENHSSPRDLTTENASKCLQKLRNHQLNFKFYQNIENRAVSGDNIMKRPESILIFVRKVVDKSPKNDPKKWSLHAPKNTTFLDSKNIKNPP